MPVRLNWLPENGHTPSHTPLAATNLFLVVKVHFTVGHLPPQPVHVLAELQSVFSLVGGLIQLLGQVEVLAVQLGVLLRQRGQLLLQICDDLQEGGELTGCSDVQRPPMLNPKYINQDSPLLVHVQHCAYYSSTTQKLNPTPHTI